MQRPTLVATVKVTIVFRDVMTDAIFEKIDSVDSGYDPTAKQLSMIAEGMALKLAATVVT